MRALEKAKKVVISTPELYEKYWPRLAAFCERLTGQRASAEDIAQEAFLRAMMNYHILAPLDERGRWSWLKKTARNLFIDSLRRDRTAQAEVPETPVEEDFTRAEVWRAIGELRDGERELFYLRYFAGFNSAELGKLFDLSPATVRSRLRSARETLKKTYFEER